MDFNLSEEQKAYQQSAAAFAAKELAPNAAQWDEESIFPIDVIKRAGQTGFCSLYTPVELGGMGLGRLDASLILEELATRLCGDLVTAGQAARGYRLTVRCVDTGNHPLDIGFSTPMRDVGPILRQFRRPIDDLSLPFGADGFRVEALNTEIFSSVQNQLGDDTATWSSHLRLAY